MATLPTHAPHALLPGLPRPGQAAGSPAQAAEPTPLLQAQKFKSPAPCGRNNPQGTTADYPGAADTLTGSARCVTQSQLQRRVRPVVPGLPVTLAACSGRN